MFVCIDLPEGLVFELLVLLQPTLLYLTNLLHFSLNPVELLGLLRIPLNCLDLQRVLHLGTELRFAPLSFARILAGCK